jgi:hypothetical protein
MELHNVIDPTSSMSNKTCGLWYLLSGANELFIVNDHLYVLMIEHERNSKAWD